MPILRTLIEVLSEDHLEARTNHRRFSNNFATTFDALRFIENGIKMCEMPEYRHSTNDAIKKIFNLERLPRDHMKRRYFRARLALRVLEYIKNSSHDA